jgi:hypothetical protein
MLQAGSANSVSQPGELKIWKIRAIKNYPEAHNHILVGKVLFRDKQHLCPIGRSSEPSY